MATLNKAWRYELRTLHPVRVQRQASIRQPIKAVYSLNPLLDVFVQSYYSRLSSTLMDTATLPGNPNGEPNSKCAFVGNQV